MIRLVQRFGVHTGRVIELDQDRIRLGRMPDNDVVFDAHGDLDASGRHAEIVRERGRYVVVDLASRNGTFLNGRRVERAPLRSGDELELGTGGPRFRVELPEAKRARERDATGRRAAALAEEPLPPTRPPPEPSSPGTSPAPREPAGERLLRVAIFVLVLGVVIAVTAIAVLLRPDD